ncbi:MULTISPECIES: glutathione-regulated potassium-efflux system protein KefC [unclassified Herbaspirillum]|uniref:glutathione-regulated potassium-efflux system protein KefC n=1 Tax=unclassified Herbaspirillum TaxID=2624150 RepID=UPI000E2F76C2|nr:MULTISPECIES: glutathione-regulated potassium-efflux system protein KefC [unclassified Herbaspirillum]RFB71137.1 glutathione-regulated potassium-efflux system protein KefC [Herbaspirillum sp. 3R-3a1]TFI08336.1 glutathione-regulated potassium-efflux system protein KefC [Herbaspirillum sp. 3R11]TFI14751.1 glutathione-regulated potassium-efflux system protein KefC [Herbaspirillum sp. 3R-11]TFI19478.1 glutathione-regulated potassium-efflux system protein KefC [Herbaspirillum sp. 3C11]
MEQTLLHPLIYLLAAVVAVPIAKKLGLGAVLGYLLAGIAIGPWGLGLISEVEDILHFSEFGVVLLLFLIGLELDPKRLWSLRRHIFGWGSAQVGLVSLGLFGAALAVGIDWRVALIGALGMSLSSTAIALATLGERKLTATPAGSAGFAILLFQDIAAIPMMAAVPLLGVAVAQGSGQGWLHTLQVVAVIALLIFGGRYLIRPILRIIAKTDMREIFTAFSLLLVIATCLLMQSVGMSMALGTFLAGVLLADSEYRHALESDLEPFKGLLLGLFFIAVGMSVDFGIFLEQPWLILGMVLGFLVIKTAVLYGLAKCFRIPRDQQIFFAFLLSQGGEFAFVVFGAAATAQVLTPRISSILVVVVALSMVITPLLLLLHDRVILPRLQARGRQPEDDIEPQDNPVIIAGFGRFGQIVGRLLHANGIGLTILDHDPDQIESLRKFGFKVFYGDATRIDLLRTAGADKARLIVIAIDDAPASLKLVEAVQRAFPHLKIAARARNVTHLYDLMDRGVTVLERETFESALQMGRQVLRQLDFGSYRAHRAAMKFRAHNIETLHKLYPHYKDQQQLVSMAVQAREELEAMFASDNDAITDGDKHRWD